MQQYEEGAQPFFGLCDMAQPVHFAPQKGAKNIARPSEGSRRSARLLVGKLKRNEKTPAK